MVINFNLRVMTSGWNPTYEMAGIVVM